MIRFSLIFGAAATLLAFVGWNGEIALSVALGGAMGLANLWLWRRIVGGLIARQTDAAKVSTGGLAVQMLLKLGLLAICFYVAVRADLDLLGLAAGFGSTLAGALAAGWWST